MTRERLSRGHILYHFSSERSRIKANHKCVGQVAALRLHQQVRRRFGRTVLYVPPSRELTKLAIELTWTTTVDLCSKVILTSTLSLYRAHEQALSQWPTEQRFDLNIDQSPDMSHGGPRHLS
jgi:hypothetical protein